MPCNSLIAAVSWGIEALIQGSFIIFASGLFANTLLLGFVTESVGAVGPEAVREALLARIPAKVKENTEAFELGRSLARNAIEDKR